MANIDIPVVASANDGDWAGTTLYTNNGVSVRAGKQSTLAGGIFARFTNVQINGTITAAYIRLRSAANQANTVPLRIRAEDIANPTAPTSAADCVGRTRTTAYADWTPGAWALGGYYNSPSLVNILQELVDSYTYDGSQAIVIFIEDNGAGTNLNRVARAFEHDPVLSAPILHIDYTPANTPPAVAPNTADAAALTPQAALEFTGTDLETNDLRYQIRISDRQDFAGAGSLMADSYTPALPSGIVHPNPSTNLSWQGNYQVDDRPGQSFTAAGGVLDKIRVKFGGDTDTNGHAVIRVYDTQGTHGTNAEPLNAADPPNTPTPGWLAISDLFPFSSVGAAVGWREFPFSGANRIRLAPGHHYMLVLDWIPVNSIYANTITVQVDMGLGHAGNAYLDGDAPPNNGVRTDFDMVFEVYEVGIALDKTSGTDPGFTNTVNSGDADPFTSGDRVRYTVQAGDELTDDAVWHWQARAIDPAGSNLWSSWTAVRTFTVEEEEEDETPRRVPFLAGLF